MMPKFDAKYVIRWHLDEIVKAIQASSNPDIMTALGQAVVSFGHDAFKTATYDALRQATAPLTIRAWNKDKTVDEAVALAHAAKKFVDAPPVAPPPVLKG